MQSISWVLKLNYLLSGVALISHFALITFQRSLLSLIPFMWPIKSLTLWSIYFKSSWLLSFQTSKTSSIVTITIPLNSGNVSVISIGISIIKSTKKLRLLVSCLFYCAKIHRILARKTKVMTLLMLGKWYLKPQILKGINF